MAFLGEDSDKSRSKIALLPLLDLELFDPGVKVHAFMNSFSARFIFCSLAAGCSMERSNMPVSDGDGDFSPTGSVNVLSVGNTFQTKTYTWMRGTPR
jgi:hypothetical protein